MRIDGQKVTVLGAGLSGLSAAMLLQRKGATVFVSEQKSIEASTEAAHTLSRAGIDAEFGGHSPRVLNADWVVVSPGMALTAPVLREAERKHIPLFGELEVASWFCTAPIVAVTGSNGKSTTTALIGEMFKASGKPTVVAGNIGRPFCEDAEALPSDGVAVLEVSSFQLETIRTFRPKTALYLNLSQDHLNRHGTLEQYGRIKARIFENQTESDFAVLNSRDEGVLRLSQQARSQKAYFGADVPARLCGFVRNGQMVLRVQNREEPLIAVREAGMRGEHNTANALAAALACRLMGLTVDLLASTLRTFQGLPHRLESIRQLDGIDYVNDSKATNVDSVWYALNSYDKPIVLIAGGRDKDSDFTALRERIREKTRAIVLIGEAADKMENAFSGLKPMVRARSLEEAVLRARELAHHGDVVLLSPACASFDMFRNFEDRGDQFRRLVNGLI